MKIKVYAFAVYLLFWLNYQVLKAFLKTGSIIKASLITLNKLEEKKTKFEDEFAVLEAEYYMLTHRRK